MGDPPLKTPTKKTSTKMNPSMFRPGLNKIKEHADDNKDAKDQKRENREVVKANKETIEALKNVTDSSKRVEDLLTNLAPAIAAAVGKEFRNAMNEKHEIKNNIFDNTNETPNLDKILNNIDKDPLSLTQDNHHQTTNWNPIPLNTQPIDNQNQPEGIKNKNTKRNLTQSTQKTLPNAQIQPSGRTRRISLPETQPSQSLNLKLTPTPTQEMSTQDKKIKELEERIKTLENLMDKINKNEPQKTNQNKIQENQKIKQRAANMDMDGNTILENSQRLEEQPLDWATVTSRRTFKDQRKQLSDTVNEKVDENLQKHFEKINENGQIKLKPNKPMDNETRLQKITEMLKDSSLYVGVAPIGRDHINRVADKLLKRGIIDKNAPTLTRIQITVKSLVKSWSIKYLGMIENNWNEMSIDKIQTTDNSDIIFIKFKNQSDATRMTSKARNLPTDSGQNTPRLVMHVDTRAKKRHQAILQIAKTMREHSGNQIQTSVRAGRRDFLLRSQQKGSNTPWQEIAPVILNKKIPEFEIGNYLDIFNDPEQTTEDEENEDDEEEIRRITKEIRDNEKRDRSEPNESNNTTEISQIDNKRKHRKTHNMSGTEDNILNSTPIPMDNENITDIPETPINKNLPSSQLEQSNKKSTILVLHGSMEWR